ncbi:Ent-kaurene oxidase [Mycena venus]|uniref:Ent-kaurene oxidase n=1 Tax=Mycena venus TaxID=2733690 RepID=A0A8H6U3K3_9AGAR|nr:Ent-kaurene oxidase [Mycena venus]
MLNGAAFVAIAFTVVFFGRLRRKNRPSLPRSVLDSEGLVAEGWRKFGGKPFILPSMTGEWIILGPEFVEVLRKSDDTVFNAPIRNIELFQPRIMFGDIVSNPYHIGALIRSDLTKALRSIVPEILEEAQLAIPEKLKISDTKDSVTLPLFDTMVSLVARVSNRAMIGAPGCRNDKFLARQVSVAAQAIPMAQVLNWFPQILRRPVWKVFSLLAGSKDECVRLLTPYVQSRVDYAQQDNPSTITDLLLRYAPEEDVIDVRRLATRVVHLNMASIHTSSIFTTHALFELARLPPNQITQIRAEIADAITSEGGICNKAAVDKFHILDSLLKEVGRYHSLFAAGSSRITLREAVVAEGVVLPPGSVVSLAPKPLHFNPQVYPEPLTFDPFRFSKLRTGEPGASDVRQAFTSLSNDYIVFGVGTHACPGRFFAALKIKVILCEILMNYDVSFPSGESTMPKPFAFNMFTMPNRTARLVFTKRKA